MNHIDVLSSIRAFLQHPHMDIKLGTMRVSGVPSPCLTVTVKGEDYGGTLSFCTYLYIRDMCVVGAAALPPATTEIDVHLADPKCFEIVKARLYRKYEYLTRLKIKSLREEADRLEKTLCQRESS